MLLNVWQSVIIWYCIILCFYYGTFILFVLAEKILLASIEKDICHGQKKTLMNHHKFLLILMLLVCVY